MSYHPINHPHELLPDKRLAKLLSMGFKTKQVRQSQSCKGSMNDAMQYGSLQSTAPLDCCQVSAWPRCRPWASIAKRRASLMAQTHPAILVAIREGRCIAAAGSREDTQPACS